MMCRVGALVIATQRIGYQPERSSGVCDMARNRIVWFNILCLACMVTVGVSPVGVSPAGAQTSTKKPVVERSPLLKEPTTPEESFAASVLMVDLARLDLAAKYLDQFQEFEG